MFLPQRSFKPFYCRCDGSSELGSAKRQGDDGDAGRASKVPRMEKNGKKREVPPTSSVLEAGPITGYESGTGKAVGRERL